MRRMILVVLSCLTLAAAGADAAGKEVAYQAGTTTLKGYLAGADGAKKRPGVLVVHEWWGNDAYARKRADMLAAAGYAALALDMYGDGMVAQHPQEAGAFSKAALENFPRSKERFEAAMNLLKSQPGVDPAKVAAIGYCFGGAVVLNMARAGEDLKGVASFHGSLFAVQPASSDTFKAKVLVATGGDDMMITPAQVETFKQEMAAAGVKPDVVVYPGAKHGFTNPEADEKGKKFNLPVAYDAKADKDSWKRLLAFLKDAFKN
jgi:dienelactone hydrolase